MFYTRLSFCSQGRVSVPGPMFLPGVFVKRGSLSRGVSIWRSLYRRSLSRIGSRSGGGLCQGSLSKAGKGISSGEIYVRRGSLSTGGLCQQGVSVNRGSLSTGGLCQQGVSVNRGSLSGVPVQGSPCMGIYVRRGSLSWGSLSGAGLCKDPPIPKLWWTIGRYASFWNAFFCRNYFTLLLQVCYRSRGL